MSDNSSTNSSSDVSSSESEEESFNDIKELCENFAKLKPYDFEPLASTDESEGDEEDEKMRKIKKKRNQLLEEKTQVGVNVMAVRQCQQNLKVCAVKS